jgi:hypothetical protein
MSQDIGWSFPPVFERDTRVSRMHSGLGNLAKCMKIMLATQPGERNQQAGYGSDLSGLAFDSLSYELLEEAEQTIDSSISSYEPRIGIHDIQVAPDPQVDGKLIVQVEYSNKEGEGAVTQIPLNIHSSLPVEF